MEDMPSAPYRVVIAAARPSIRAGLRAMLERYSEFEVAEARQPRNLEADAEPRAADVIVVDLDGEAPMSVAEVIEQVRGIPLVIVGAGAEELRAAAPDRRGVVVVAEEVGAEELAVAVRAASLGFVAVGPDVVRLPPLDPQPSFPALDAAAIDALSDREREVLGLLAEGLANKRIAQALQISEHTVKFHVSAILSKLGAASRTEAVTLAARRGLLAL